MMLSNSRFALRAVLVLGVAALVTVLCSAPPAQAAVRQVTITPVADLGLYYNTDGQDRANRESGGRVDFDNVQTTLIKFDISSKLNPDESVIGATLQLYAARDDGNSLFDQHVVAYPLAAAWQEGSGKNSTVGDVDFDGHVDVVDLLMFADGWAMSPGDPGYNALCDLNADNAVDIVDLLILASNWGQ